MKKTVQIPFKDGSFEAHVSVPEHYNPDTDKLSGMIVIHEIWSLNDHTRDVADRVAELGYISIAPDLLSHTGITEKVNPQILKEMADPATKDEAQKKMREATAPLQQPEFADDTVARIQACYDYLQTEYGCPKIGCMGFCFGGTYTFAFAASQPALSAALVFYGQPPKDDSIPSIKSPLIAFYGERDEHLVNGIPDLQAKFEAAGKTFEHYVYPNTGHAFFNDTNPAMYNEEAAKDSWKKTVEFLKQNLA